MSIVKDMSLAPSGHQKIQWVRDFMPALSGIEERFRREKPFEGLTIAVSVHLEAKTANLGLVLREGGAKVYLTGCKDVIVERHFQVMKDNAILCNSGHFDCEVDVKRLGELAVERFSRRENIEGFRLPDGRTLNVLAEGRLVNLAAGNGHPAEIMDMSFAVQALSLEWMAKHAGQLEKKVYNVPEEIDDQIGRVKLAAMGLSIDTLTQEQKDYLAGWEA